MKDKDLKKALKEYAGSPDYMAKDAFIKKMQKENASEKVNVFKIIAVQAPYIRFYVWIISAFLLITPMLTSVRALPYTLDIMAEIMPFFAGIGVFEAMRSKMHDMSELETATLLSKRGAFFARMITIGIVQFAVILVSSIVISLGTGNDVLSIGTQLLLPFAVTNIISFMVERTQFGRENVWSCLCVSGVVFVVRQAIANKTTWLQGNTGVLVAITIILIVIQIAEFAKTVKTEKLSWN